MEKEILNNMSLKEVGTFVRCLIRNGFHHLFDSALEADPALVKQQVEATIVTTLEYATSDAYKYLLQKYDGRLSNN